MAPSPRNVSQDTEPCQDNVEQADISLENAITIGDLHKVQDILQSGHKFSRKKLMNSLHWIIAGADLEGSRHVPQYTPVEVCRDPNVYREMLDLVFPQLSKLGVDCVGCVIDLQLRLAVTCGHDFGTVYLLRLNCELNATDGAKHLTCCSDDKTGHLRLKTDVFRWAMAARSTPLIRLLLYLGCRVTPHHRRNATKLDDEDVKKKLAEPHSLLTLSKAAIRSQLGQHWGAGREIVEMGKKLSPLPPFLAREILLQDLGNLLAGKPMYCDGHVLSLHSRLESRPYSSV